MDSRWESRATTRFLLDLPVPGSGPLDDEPRTGAMPPVYSPSWRLKSAGLNGGRQPNRRCLRLQGGRHCDREEEWDVCKRVVTDKQTARSACQCNTRGDVPACRRPSRSAPEVAGSPQRAASTALLKSPTFERTPGNGSRPKRRVMSFRIDVVS